ncbi:MAG: hypothetical protein WCB57_08685 [Pseudonocardiaceae bacterium]
MRCGDEQATQGFDWFHHDDDSGEQTAVGIGRTIRPGTAVPSTALMSDMGDGSLLLEDWRDGPSAYLGPADAVPLRRELAAAFMRTEQVVQSDHGESR